MHLEKLTLENISETIALGERSHLESAWKDYEFNYDVVKRNMLNILSDDTAFTCLCRSEGKLVGYFYAQLGRFLFSDDLLGIERGFYVVPEYRGGKSASLMYSAYDSWCREMKAEPLMEIYFAEDNERTFQFLKHCKLSECGRVFRGGHYGVR